MSLEKSVNGGGYEEWVIHTDPFTANAYDGKKFFDIPLTAKLVVKTRTLKEGSIKNDYYFSAHYGNGKGKVRITRRKLQDDFISREDEERDVRESEREFKEKEVETICNKHKLSMNLLEILLKSDADVSDPIQIAEVLRIRKHAAQRYADSLADFSEEETKKICDYLAEKERHQVEMSGKEKPVKKMTYRQAYQEIIDVLQNTGCCFAEVTPRGTIKSITFGV